MTDKWALSNKTIIYMKKLRLNGLFSALAGLLLLSLAASALAADTESLSSPRQKDIRVIIDMSGSMKKNDPKNHRTKAVQLFSEILPADVMAGIWTFASDVNMLVKHEMVTPAWKKKAFNEAKKIHSKGLYTNIEKALTIATRNLQGKQARRERHVILLTDGYVDISKSSDINADSRQRIIDDVIPRLVDSHIVVHSVALSRQADHKLLKLLSEKTGGRYAVINRASDLDRYFFKLFQSTAKPDTVPFKGNKFSIDKSINDMTVVLFNGDHPARLISPDKLILTHSSYPSSVKWVKSDNYEIITVSKPEPGEWSVDAPLDPDNKIMVVTNLKLQVKPLPTLVLSDQAINLEAAITEKGKIIKTDDFTKLVEIDTLIKKEGSLNKVTGFAKYQGNGYFSSQMQTGDLDGDLNLTVTATSPTFVREYTHQFSVVTQPYTIESLVNEKNNINLGVSVDSRLFDRDKTTISLMSGTEQKALTLSEGLWQIELAADQSEKTVAITIDSTFHQGKKYNTTIDYKLPAVAVVAAKEKQMAPEVIAEKPQQEAVKAAPVATESEKTEEPENVEEEPSLNWVVVFISVLVVNVILIAVGYVVYKKYFSKKKSDEDDDIFALDSTEAGGAEESTENDDDTIEDLEDMDTDDSEKKSDG